MGDQSLLLDAHGELDDGALVAAVGLRDVVRSSWQRSLDYRRDPDRSEPVLGLDRERLRQARSEHPLRFVLPVFEKLLVAPATGTGLLVAIADERGRMLWVLGDDDALRRASGMGFEAGMDWSESSIGTSAPGTALATGAGVQIRGAEHFARSVHPWSCTAVPIRDPGTGRVLGVVDLTGDENAVAQHSMPLLDAAVAAAQAEMRMQSYAVARMAGADDRIPEGDVRIPEADDRSGPHRTGSLTVGSHLPEAGAGSAVAGAAEGTSAAGVGIVVTGSGVPVLDAGSGPVRMRLRHAEILALLAHHPDGVSSAELAELLGSPGRPIAEATLRAEMARLRKFVARWCPDMRIESRPYRLSAPVDADFAAVGRALDDGDIAGALSRYRGKLLVESESAALVELRGELGVQLRNAVLDSADADELYAYLQLPEARDDGEAWRMCLEILPARSHKRSIVVARLESLVPDA